MNTPRVLLLALALILAVSGCMTTGLSTRESHYHYPGMIAGLYRSDQEGPAPRPPRVPIRLAVGQLGEPAPSRLFMEEVARESALVASVTSVPIAGSVVSYEWNRPREKVDLAEMESHLRSALKLGRDLGAQYLFVFGGAIDSYSTMNPLSVFDLTLIGGCLVPGTTIHTEGRISGALLDIESGRGVFVVSADHRKRRGAPTYFVEGHQKHYAAEVRDALMGLLAREFTARLGQSETAAAIESDKHGLLATD